MELLIIGVVMIIAGFILIGCSLKSSAKPAGGFSKGASVQRQTAAVPLLQLDENDGWAWFFEQQQQQLIFDEQNRLFEEQCRRDMEEHQRFMDQFQQEQFDLFNQQSLDLCNGFGGCGGFDSCGGFGF